MIHTAPSSSRGGGGCESVHPGLLVALLAVSSSSDVCGNMGLQQAESESPGRAAGRGATTATSSCKWSRTMSWAVAVLRLVFVVAQLQVAHACFGKKS